MTNKVRMLCLYQEGSVSAAAKKRLGSMARSTYHQHFGNHYKVFVLWIMIPKGQAYIAGEPSKATTITINVAEGTADAKRHAFMASFCSQWMNLTGCGENQIILSVMDESLATEYTKRSLSRLDPLSRKYHLARLILSMLFNKIFRGHFEISTNIQ